jgi:pimeloyl-ACP methyl ester carboxylesterase
MMVPLAAALLGAALQKPQTPVADRIGQAPSFFASFDGLKVHYKVLGSGQPTLVLVHGWTCNLGFWKAQAPLADQMRVVLVDLPGHGRSDKPERVYSMELLARAVDAVLREAKIEQAVLVGHSMGTPVVWQFSRLFPERTQALIAVDGSFRSNFTTQEERERWASRHKGQDYRTRMAARLDGLIGTTASPELRDEIKGEMLKTPQHVAASCAYEMTDPKVYLKDPPIGVPVLGIYTTNTASWPSDYRPAIAAFIPKLEYRTMEGAGHFLMMERPDAFNDLVRAFLRQHGLLKAP